MFKIICDGFDRHTISFQCHCCANSAWHKDQGSWGRGVSKFGLVIGVPTWQGGQWGSQQSWMQSTKPLCPAVQVRVLHIRKQKVLLNEFPAELGRRKLWWEHGPTEKTRSVYSFLFFSSPIFTFLHKGRASPFSAELLKQR